MDTAAALYVRGGRQGLVMLHGSVPGFVIQRAPGFGNASWFCSWVCNSEGAAGFGNASWFCSRVCNSEGACQGLVMLHGSVPGFVIQRVRVRVW